MVEEIRSFVEEECRKPTSKYGYDSYTCHFVSVVKNAGELADRLGADKEVVLVAAWLHDIGSIVDGRDNHHITGPKIAEKKLKELNYPSDKIELVKECIFNHRSSVGNKAKSLEGQIIIEADALSNFDNIAGIFKAAYSYEGKTQEEARESVRSKLEKKWNQLQFEDSKKIIKPKYEAAMLLLKG